jgi:hypothetical protein
MLAWEAVWAMDVKIESEEMGMGMTALVFQPGLAAVTFGVCCATLKPASPTPRTLASLESLVMKASAS